MNTYTQERSALLTRREAGAILGLGKASMRRLVEVGALKPVQIAGLSRPKFRRADVEALVRDGRAP